MNNPSTRRTRHRWLLAIGAAAVSQLPVLATTVYGWKDGGTGMLLAARGAGAGLGPIIGAVLLTVVNEGLSTFAQAEIARIIYGALFIVVTIFMPNGIIDFFRKKDGRR